MPARKQQETTERVGLPLQDAAADPNAGPTEQRIGGPLLDAAYPPEPGDPVPASPGDEVGQAEQEVREAEELIKALEDRVRDGDPDVTPGELAEKRGLLDFARLRVDAARKKAARRRAEARRARMVEAVTAARGFNSQDAEVEQAIADVSAAMFRVVELLETRDQAARKLIQQTSAAYAEAEEHGELGQARELGMGHIGSRDFTFRREDGTRGRIRRIGVSEGLGLALHMLNRRIMDRPGLDRTEAARQVAVFAPLRFDPHRDITYRHLAEERS